MAIEVISTIRPKNNGDFPIVLSNDLKGGIHYVEKINDIELIPKDRVQYGMLCYAKKEDSYFVYLPAAITKKENGETITRSEGWQLIPGFASTENTINLSELHKHANKDVLDKITDENLTKLAGLENYDDTEIRRLVDDKVDKIEGHSLISDENLTKLAGLENYDDTEIRRLIDEKTVTLDDTYQRIFRVDNDNEVEQILNNYGNAVGTGSMAFVKSTKNTYLFLGDNEWANINTFGNNSKIHVGDTPPDDKTMIWIDTSDDTINENILEETNNSMLKAILDSISSLRKDVDTIKSIIKNGNITWPDDDDDNDPVETVTYLVDESGEYIFITEDGDCIIDELVEYTEPEKPIVLTSRLCLENGDFFITESGDYIVDETNEETEEPEVPSATVGNKLIGETGDTLITEIGDTIIQEM